MSKHSDSIAKALEALDEGFVIFDNEAKMVFCNAQYQAMYRPVGHQWNPGTTLDQIARDTAIHCMGLTGEEKIDDWVKDRVSLHSSSPEPFEQCLTNGRCLRVSETNLANGWVVGTRTDITTLKEQSRALEENDARMSRLVDELLESNAELERFAHVASHDLQAPLRRIMAYADLLNADCRDQIGECAQNYIAGILRSSKRMNELIKDLLEDAKAGAPVPESVQFDAAESLAQVLENLDDALKTSGAWFSCDRMPVLYGNPLRFSRLLENLIGNALKYSSHDRTPNISLTVENRQKEWRFDLRDNGSGIDPRSADRIFQPFVRLDSNRSSHGTGMGLSICRKVVEGFGGEIWAEPNESHGSTFSFTIPIKTDTAPVPTSNTGDEPA